MTPLTHAARPPELIAWDAPAVPSEWLVALRSALHVLDRPRAPVQRILKINRYRTTVLATGFDEHGPIVAKVWHDPRRVARLVRIGRHPMSREIDAARALAARGTLSAPVCVGSGRSRSLIPDWGIALWRYVDGVDLNDPSSPLADPAVGTPILTDLLAALSRDGWRYGDLHGGNVRWSAETKQLTIVDLAALTAGGRWSAGTWRAHAAQALAMVAGIWSMEAQRAFLTAVAALALPGEPRAHGAFVERVRRRMMRSRSRHIASRVKRCLKESSEFTFDPAAGLWLRRSEAPTLPAKTIEQANEIRAAAQQAMSDTVLKIDRKTTVVRVPATGAAPARVVKFFRPGSVAKHFAMSIGLRIGNGRHAWLGARMLEVVGVPAARAIAYAAGASEETIVFEDLAVSGGGELDRIWSRREDVGLPPAREDLRETARVLDLLAATPFWHKDLKTCNWWRRDDGTLALLDTDAVWWRRGALRRRLRRVMLSLHRSAPPTLSGFRRVRFALSVYRRVLGEDGMPWLRSIFREEAAHILHYICDEGDRRRTGNLTPWWTPAGTREAAVYSSPPAGSSPNG